MIRNPRAQPRDNYTGAVCMTRCGFRLAACESMLEMDYLVQRDAFDFALSEVIAQPMTVGYFYDGKRRTWTPDFRIKSGNARRLELVEVKTWSFLYPKDEQQRIWIHGKFAAIAAAVNRLKVKGPDDVTLTFRFVLCTDREIRVQPRQHNANLMVGSVSSREPDGSREAEVALLSLPHSATVRDLQNVLGPKHDAFALALWLAWRGLIRLDPSEKWSRDTAFVRTERQLS